MALFFFTKERHTGKTGRRTLRGPRTQDPRPYEEPGNYEEPGPYDNPGSYEDSEFFDDPEKTQELINELKFLDFHIMCSIWWNLQLKADLFVIAECR